MGVVPKTAGLVSPDGMRTPLSPGDKICRPVWVGGLLNSLTAIDGHDRQYFNELRSTVVSRQIFIRSQSLIAR